MKGANDWGVWIPKTPGFFGTWDLSGQILTPNGKNTAGLSNLSVYVASPSPIPLPAAGWLLIGGIGGLVALGRRKRLARRT
ncbi:VPLPA-CTERM sorting domain-containing protein [Ruegeria atlantica]|nr:VPLPA-CTERM sorting domain-containing protein [Ruegeria atlantica]